jgi:hypothetical protein
VVYQPNGFPEMPSQFSMPGGTSLKGLVNVRIYFVDLLLHSKTHQEHPTQL